MKTTPLDELLTQIIPLPWQSEQRIPHVWAIFQEGHIPHGNFFPRGLHFESADDDLKEVATCELTAAYATHAANVLPACVAALRALTDWGRTHTSPLDANSPHALLIQATEALTAAENIPV